MYVSTFYFLWDEYSAWKEKLFSEHLFVYDVKFIWKFLINLQRNRIALNQKAKISDMKLFEANEAIFQSYHAKFKIYQFNPLDMFLARKKLLKW